MRRFQHFFHAGGFKLEYGGGVGVAENLVGGLVVERDFAHVNDVAGGVFDVVLRHFDDGEVAQAQKVEFHQTHVFHVAFVVHRYGRGGLVSLVNGAVIGDFSRRDEYAARVHTQAAREVFEFFRQRDEFAGFFGFD